MELITWTEFLKALNYQQKFIKTLKLLMWNIQFHLTCGSTHLIVRKILQKLFQLFTTQSATQLQKN